VLDESMGDAVKFTVIATGFREDMPARRERMMAGSTLPTARQDVPVRIVTRPIVSQPVAVPTPEPEFAPEPVAAVEPEPIPPPVARAPFASETGFALEPVWEAAAEPVAEEPVVEPPPVEEPKVSYPTSSYYEAARQQAWQEPARVEPVRVEPVRVEPVIWREPEPERPVEEPVLGAPEPVGYRPLIVEHIPPVPVSSEPAPQPVAVREPELVPVKASVFDDDFFRKPMPEPVTEEVSHRPEARVPSFAGYAPESPTHAAAAETDELDIPAFLRRGH
jgi:cell division protein FtsZ